jgi:hypothetical protein
MDSIAPSEGNNDAIRIPTLFGLTRGVAVPLFFCKIALSISENPLMVVKNL